jgi:hypothetical protein
MNEMVNFDSDYITDNFDNSNFDYCGYKPVSALFPKTQIQDQLPPGYTTSNIFALAPENGPIKEPYAPPITITDDYVVDNFPVNQPIVTQEVKFRFCNN